jgi:hypothetical protein
MPATRRTAIKGLVGSAEARAKTGSVGMLGMSVREDLELDGICSASA